MQNERVHIKIYSDIKDIGSITTAVKQLELKNFDVDYSFPQVIDIKQDEIIIIQVKGIESKLLGRIIDKRNGLKNKIIFVTRENNALLISTIAKLGFSDIFIFPYEIYKFISYLSEILSNKSYLTGKRKALKPGEDSFSVLIGQSEEFLKVIELSKKVSENSTASILILGETGTGKGILARAIHDNSKFSDAPFVDIVCSAIPESLLESELFGYERGAFTSAHNKKLGLFELAENGTIFLDEVGDLTLNLQVKLLRVIEKKVIRRLGGFQDIPVNARIISATNKDLEEMLRQKLFRRDLYHRLNVVSLDVPPVRARDKDVLLLANSFIDEFNKQFNKNIKGIDDELLDFMTSYSWPGNVREIRNAIERAVLLSDDKKLHMKDFSNVINNIPLNTPEYDKNISKIPDLVRLDINFTAVDLKSLNRLYAKEVLKKMNGNKSKTAKTLGISRPKLDSLLSKE